MNKSKELTLALAQFKKGDFVIVLDDKNRENEGDLVLAAQDITPKKVNFMLTYGKGLICVPMRKKRLLELDLPIMVEKNEEKAKCIFTISTDAKRGITTGISASDRAKTILLLSKKNSTKGDFVRPGHIFPLMASDEGLKARRGHTEASIELCKRCGKQEVAVICEILNPDGSVAKGNALTLFGKKHKIPLIHINDLTER